MINKIFSLLGNSSSSYQLLLLATTQRMFYFPVRLTKFILDLQGVAKAADHQSKRVKRQDKWEKIKRKEFSRCWGEGRVKERKKKRNHELKMRLTKKKSILRTMTRRLKSEFSVGAICCCYNDRILFIFWKFSEKKAHVTLVDYFTK